MKKIFTILIFAMIANLSGQELKYEEVVSVDPAISKVELYNRARTWVANNFKSEKDAVVIDDKDTGEVTGNGTIRYDPEVFYLGYSCAKGYINYKINLYVKDGRYKYSINSFNHEGTPCGIDGKGVITSYGLITMDKKSENGPKAGWNEIKDLINVTVPKVINSLKEAMNKKHESSKDW
ncbi:MULTISPECIES: DUF4468 domain-containing protein [unclassified Chryseobacterium]|uniref:DUF4468 domain-containing protein n=1 Tax=unclassified Chryseobacterium TaxID=2593645 RepID=UPI0028531C5E|nr:DUF4468 domain-containing protein [Chryseobacterium sp. CFS7]MDR4892231.1 DUF4468 domain-containing protein [Chryseobacterium sp. CFS7]